MWSLRVEAYDIDLSFEIEIPSHRAQVLFDFLVMTLDRDRVYRVQLLNGRGVIVNEG